MDSNEIQIHEQLVAIDKENKNSNEDLEQDYFQNISNISYDGKNIIDSVACSKAVCFATGNQIQLYNESYTEHLATVTLDCTPEHLCVSRDENFIIIADNIGRIHFFHLQSRNIIFSQQIVEPNKHSKLSCFLSLCFNIKK
ncbi:hypothetical protein H8356DRAFT_968046 [Neocallimastix lanati (nom. inval.)]|nr:hypothetical protein H8356DRAFT_968046 [Neocallimastix sp. JGI-2020a]